ncbi:MAG: hypothetical protein ACRDH8_07900 [Actinomycetota bacterium]
MLYRVFPQVPGAGLRDPGGPLYVPRFDQGGGRHDNPDAYGALYLSRVPVAPVAEHIRDLRARTMADRDLVREGARLTLVSVDEATLDGLVDLDDPGNLVTRALRPSRVATANREVTQPLALALYDEGVMGFEWWSTIEASWINVTLFADRSAGGLSIAGEAEPLTMDHPTVRDAAQAVGVFLG